MCTRLRKEVVPKCTSSLFLEYETKTTKKFPQWKNRERYTKNFNLTRQTVLLTLTKDFGMQPIF